MSQKNIASIYNMVESSLYSAILKGNFIERSNLTTRILFSFIFIAIFSQLVFSNFETSDAYGNNGYASISITSYIIILLSSMFLVFLNTIIHTESGSNATPFLRTISPELILIFIYLVWLISIYLKYYRHINLKKVPQRFFLYSNITNVVLLFQIFFFMIRFIVQNDSEIDTSDFEIKGTLDKINFVNYLIVFLNFLLILIQQIILDSFIVDIA